MNLKCLSLFTAILFTLSCANAGFPYVSDRFLDVDNSPNWIVHCQDFIDNNAYGTSTGYPEWSIISYGNSTHPNYNYMGSRANVTFFGNNTDCINIRDVCKNLQYETWEAERGAFNRLDGYPYNNTNYSPIWMNKTVGQTNESFVVCGDVDGSDTQRVMDIMVKLTNAMTVYELIDASDYANTSSIELAWMPFYDYEVCWDCINEGIEEFYWAKGRDLEDALGYPNGTFEIGATCNQTWNVDKDFMMQSFTWRNVNVTDDPYTLGDSNIAEWLDEYLLFPNNTWYGTDYLLDYVLLWNTTIADYFDMDTCTYDNKDYVPYNELTNTDTSDPITPVSINLWYNLLETGVVTRINVKNNLTISKKEYYIIEDHPYKTVYKFIRELEPILGPSNWVSVVVPITHNVSDRDYMRSSNLNGSISTSIIGSTVYITEQVNPSNPTWTNSAENFTLEVGVCKSGAWYLEGDCYSSPTMFGIAIGRTTFPMIAGLIVVVILAGIVLFFKKGVGKGL